MFEIAGVHFIRRVFSALAVVALAALLGACALSSPPDPDGPKSGGVENVASKSTAELYADVIKPGVFERSSSKVIDGYTVESGNLRMPDKSEGSLVTVRSADGSLTALVERTGMRGLLVINKKGEKTFNPDRASGSLRNDVEVNTTEERKLSASGSQAKSPMVVDILIGYSRAAVVSVGGDATSHALALVESANLALRNSLVASVSLSLVGVQVIERNYPINSSQVRNIQSIFSEGMRALKPDMLYAIFSGHPDDDAAGRGQMPGRFAVGYPEAFIFRHEIGHNAGGLHCPSEPGALVRYGHGYNNGKSNTAQCGEEGVYYSTPAVIDQFGLPKGNAFTADMARVWRENARRLSSYALPFTGERISLISIGESSEVHLELNMPARYQAGIVALDSAEGPTDLAPAPRGYTRLAVKLRNASGDEREVYLRAERSIGECEWFAMNAYAACPFSGSTASKIYFKLTFNAADNPTLPNSIYNGGLKLEARNLVGSWRSPVTVLVSVAGSH